MKQIRQRVFETNSSSTHSITISEEDGWYYPKFIPTIEFGEFGWAEDEFEDFTDKISYVITMIATKNGVNDFDSFLKTKEFIWLKGAVEQHCGLALEIRPLEGWSPLGYVDHQSDDTLDQFWSNDEVKFKVGILEFIFNKKYGFKTDNDNHD